MSKIVQGAIQAITKKAIALAPESWVPGGVPDPLIRERHGHVGSPVSRIDGPLKVKGQARFAAEVPMERLTHAALLTSSIARGRLAEIDVVEAAKAPGVVLVMTHRNAPKMAAPPLFDGQSKGAAPSTLPIMQDDRVHWNGQPIALVLAETQEQADHAKSLIRVRYEAEPSAVDYAVERDKAFLPDSVLGEPPEFEIGKAEAALAEAPFAVDIAYRTPRHSHNAIELHAATLFWDGDRLTVHDASQAISHAAHTHSIIFGIPEQNIRVVSPYVGGGFGGKTFWWHQPLAAAASKLAGRPVRIVLSREGVFRSVGHRTPSEQRVALGADKDGKLTALIHEGITTMTDHNNFPEQFSFPARHLYAAPNIRLVQKVTLLDMVPNTFMRAPGESIGTFALETAIDELAEKLGMDPIELRRRNEPEKDPTSGLPFSSRNIVEAYRAGAERFGWSARQTKPRARHEGEWLLGMGCATATYPYYRMPGGAARITLTRDGDAAPKATIAFAAHEMGMGTATTQTLVGAERLGLALEQVTIEHGDSDLPGVILAGGSQQTASIGAGVTAAHRALVTELLKLAGNDSPLAGLKPEEVGCRDAGIAKLDEPERFESYASILGRAQRDSVTVTGEAPPPFEMMHWSMHSYGAVFAEVRVNAVTGETRVERLLGSYDCGRILNPKTAASQFRGGLIMGLGLALMEETLFDPRNGRVANASLAEYHVPVHMDVPEIDVIWTDIPDPHAPMGAHGVGEIGITGTGAAVANAVYNATGIRVRELPITLDKLMG